MRNKLNIIILLSIMGFASCKSYLDVEIKSNIVTENFFKTQADFDLALTGAYDPIGNHQDNSGFGTYFRGLLIMGRAGTDEGYISKGFGQYGNEISEYTFTASAQIPASVWEFQYKGISRANTIISRIEKSDAVISKTELERISGEAYFLRAFYYFQLVRYFGGVPLILDEIASIDQVNAKRAEIADVYKQIIADFNKAEQLLPVNNGGGRATKYAATAFLAKVYLQMSGYPLQDKNAAAMASEKANKVIKEGNYALLKNYADVFKLENEYGKEYIFSAQFAFCGNCEGGQVGTWDGVPGDWTYARTYSIFKAFDELYDSYGKNDPRRDYNVVQYRVKDALGNTESLTDENKYAFKWRHDPDPKKRPGGEGFFEWQSAFDFPLIRYADVLLMFAEAENRKNNGPTPEAYAAINQVRRRAYGLSINTPSAVVDLASGLSFTAFQKAVLDERKWELCFEGQRWHDLVRFGELVNAVKSVNSPASLLRCDMAKNIQAHHVLFPIPPTQIQLSKGVLTQNPNY